MSRRITAVARAYLVLLLAAGSILAPSVVATFAVILMVVHMIAFMRPPSPRVDMVLALIGVLLASIALEATIGSLLAAALPTPAWILIVNAVGSVPPTYPARPLTSNGRAPSVSSASAVAALFGIGLLGGFASSWVVLLSAFVMLAALAVAIILIARRAGRDPIVAEGPDARVIAHGVIEADVIIHNRTRMGRRILLSANDQWLTISPDVLDLRAGASTPVRLSGSPPLAGPRRPVIRVNSVDAWDVLWTRSEVSPLLLNVVPRAKYAAWLARQFLERSRPAWAMGMDGAEGRLRGPEFYGIRHYQPGDRLRDVDWRHTSKLREMVVRENRDTEAGGAVIVVNLVVDGEEQADWLAFHLITAAVSAARRGVGISVVAYDRVAARHATALSSGDAAVRDALRLSRRIIVESSSERLLSPADAVALTRDTRQVQDSTKLADAGSRSVHPLASLVVAELTTVAAAHPLADLMSATLRQVPPPATITVVSAWNHDLDALAMVIPSARARGYRLLVIDPTSPSTPPPPYAWHTVIGSRVPKSAMPRSEVATDPA